MQSVMLHILCFLLQHPPQLSLPESYNAIASALLHTLLSSLPFTKSITNTLQFVRVVETQSTSLAHLSQEVNDTTDLLVAWRGEVSVIHEALTTLRVLLKKLVYYDGIAASSLAPFLSWCLQQLTPPSTPGLMVVEVLRVAVLRPLNE